MAPYKNEDLYNVLKDINIIEDRILDESLDAANKRRIPLHSVLLHKEILSDENLGQAISELISVPFVNLSKKHIDHKTLELLPKEYARANAVILFDIDDSSISVAMNYPFDSVLNAFLEQKFERKLNIYFATESDIAEALNLYSKSLEKSYEELIFEAINASVENDSKDKKYDTSENVPIAKIVDLLIHDAYKKKASDIHIEPEDNVTVVRFRVDGALQEVLFLEKKLHDQIVSRIKVMASLRIDEHMSAQDGKISVQTAQEDLDIRVSVVPVVDGEKVVLRLLSSRSRQLTLQELGMSFNDMNKVRKAYQNPTGMVLSTGPTGSGKTTTIYSILKILNTRDVNISTIEDPVEYEIMGVNQIQVNPRTNLTFADGLRALLRQDPNIVFVGEIRDEETAGIAVNSAMTGHLVLSTLHTNDAATTLPRLLDMGIEPYLVASTVNVIIAQRLVRKVCEGCKISVEVSAAEIEEKVPSELVKKHFGKSQKIRTYHGAGCEVCNNSGYVGRVGVFEVLEVTEKMKQLISEKRPSTELKKQAVKDGMVTMLEDGLEKVSLGMTTLDEVLRVTSI